MKQSQQLDDNYKFKNGHRQTKNFVRKLMNCIEQFALVILCGNLSKKKKLKDKIPRSHPEIDTCCADLSLIFMLLFVS